MTVDELMEAERYGQLVSECGCWAIEWATRNPGQHIPIQTMLKQCDEYDELGLQGWSLFHPGVDALHTMEDIMSYVRQYSNLYVKKADIETKLWAFARYGEIVLL